MAEINFPVVEVGYNKFLVVVDKSLYVKEVITSAIYKFSHLYYIHQVTDVTNQNLVNITFESKDGNIVAENIPKQFCNELIDQQIRYNVEIQFGRIRDMIVEEAFKPVTLK